MKEYKGDEIVKKLVKKFDRTESEGEWKELEGNRERMDREK